MKTLSILRNQLTAVIIYCVFPFLSFAQVPAANFTGNPLAGCSPLVVSFQDLSSNNPTSWSWDFGNGTTSTVQNPTATYFNSGTYTVRLTATNGSGSNTLTRTSYVTVFASPIVNFTVNDSSGCFPHPVQFTDLSSAGSGNTIASWEWNFGDGATSTLQNPTHIYTSGGNFTVTLKITNDKGCIKTFSKLQYIQVNSGVVPDFSNLPPLICSPPVSMSFTNSSTGPGVLTYNWNFGDGGTSTQQNPSHVYNASGTFNVSLTVTSSIGCSATIVKNNAVVISTNSTSFSVPDSICVNAPVSFMNSSWPVANSQSWDFADGSGSSASNPVKTYSSPGNYTVILTNYYSGCSDTAMRALVVAPKPIAGFNSNDTINCQSPLTVNFQNTSTGAVSWIWDFGDGATSTLQNPVHTYTSNGNFNIRLIATNSSGCSDTITKNNFIRIARAAISISGLPRQGCVPYTINPVPAIISLDAVTSYLWDFGDGTTSTTQNPSHTYTTQGTYTVRLIITTSLGCTDTLTLLSAVKVGTLPTVDFTADQLTVCAFTQIQFTDLSTAVNEWLWDFGDGTSSGAQNPTHQYSSAGTFTVSLTAKNNGCPATRVKNAYITVFPPVAEFAVTPDCSNRTRFTFNDASTGPLTWFWDFGDGTTSTLQNPPPHIFPSLGTYTVSLTVTNGGCSDTKIKTVKAINENPDFTSDKTAICRKDTVVFTATAVTYSSISNYLWLYGDGTQTNTPFASQGHIYNNTGNYSVSLITTDLNGCLDTVSKTNYIRASGPIANFSATNQDGCTGLTASFNDLSVPDGTNALVSWQWNFGDGSIQTFTSAPFTHTYNTTGTYSVTMKVTDAAGCSDTLKRNKLVHATDPFITFSTYNTVTCPGANINWQVTATGEITNYTWNFGDGTTANQVFPPKSYAAPGVYTVKLFITDIFGCSDSLVRPNFITVNVPQARFTMDDSVSVCAPFEVQFTNNSTFFTSQQWTFESGITSTVQNPSHYFTSPGTYNVKLKITSIGGCSDSIFRTIRLYDTTGFKVNFTPVNGCSPLTIDLNVTSNGISTFIWDFGDGQSIVSNSPNISHTYTTLGTYAPKLIMQDPTGCLIPLDNSDTIKVVGVSADFGYDKTLLCDAGNIIFTDSTVFNDPIVSYNWDFGDGNSSSQQNPVHYYSGTGFYDVTLVVHTQIGCIDIIRIDSVLKIVSSPQVRIDGDTAACANAPLQYFGTLIVPDTSIVTWNWSFGNGKNSGNQNPAPQTYNTSGNYTASVIVTNSSGCKDIATRTVRIHPLPTVSMPTDITTVAGTTINIPATYSGNMTSYLWTPPTFLNCTICPRPDVTPSFNMDYTVTFTDSNNCQNTGNILIKALCKNSNVFLPNTFSPNGDGSNDVFYPRGTGLALAKVMRIFNRWGEVVFERYDFPVNNAVYGWDGTRKGKTANADVYIYQVEIYCQNGELLSYTGNITLIR